MGGFGFGQGYFGQYTFEPVPSEPPTYIATVELAASYVPVVELEASYAPVIELPASVEGTG